MSSMTDDRTIEGSTSAVSWGAIIGGAAVAAAVSLSLLFLGSALGLSSMSPWSHPDPDAISSFTVKTAVWLIVVQWVASALGGYLAGRLRVKWSSLHTDEVFFRDTAHGFLTWAVATVVTAGLLASTAASIVSGGAHAGAMVAAGAASHAKGPDGPGMSDGYYVDMLFRSPTAKTDANIQDSRAETVRILANDLKDGDVNEGDKAYLAQLVSAHTGLNQADASKRVDDTLAQLKEAKQKVKEAAEKTRKTAMHVSIYIFLSMLVGAFIASSSAALGGRRRDEY